MEWLDEVCKFNVKLIILLLDIFFKNFSVLLTFLNRILTYKILFDTVLLNATEEIVE